MDVIRGEWRPLERIAAARLRGAQPDELLVLADSAIEQATAAGDAVGLELIAAELDAAAAGGSGNGDGLGVAAARARAALVDLVPRATAAPPPGAPMAAAATSSDPQMPASPLRRVTAFALDLVLLLAGLLVVLLVGVTIATAEVAAWVALVWAVVVVPSYFALYHAFGGPDGGPGATPGQHELGLHLRDVRTGERLGLGRALLRSYGGLAATVLVLPVVADLLALVASADGRAWHDRLFRSTVVRVRRVERELAPTAPTAGELSDVFATEGALWPRARQLTRLRGAELREPVLVLYVALVGLATVLVPMLVADLGRNAAASGLDLWTVLAFLLFLSGIYWTQAVLVAAVEAVRTGVRLSRGDLIRRASERVNALTVALLLLTILLLLSLPYAFCIGLIPLARFSLVVPAIVLEEAPVLRAFARSWRLTRGTGRALGLLLATGFVLSATIGLALGFASAIVGAVIPDGGLWAYSLGAAVALVAASVPVSLVLARVGSAWCLFYYDVRRRDDLRRLAAAGGDGGLRAATR